MRWSLFALMLVCCHSFNIPLPGGRQVTFNEDTGVLRIQLAPVRSDLKVPPKGTVPSSKILNSIEVKDTGVNQKGYGAFTTGPIEKDKFLGFYEGDIISSREDLDSIVSDRKRKIMDSSGSGASSSSSGQTNAMDYVMSLDGGATFMDGYSRAQDRSAFSAVHLNHADKETEECNVIRLLEDDRVAFYTSRNILPDEELCFDYGMQFWDGREHQKI